MRNPLAAARPTPNEYGFHFTAGAGNYDSVNALSMGFIYAHEDFTISVGHAKSDQGGPTMTNIGFSYPVGNLNIPPKPPIVDTFSFNLATKALPASISTPELL